MKRFSVASIVMLLLVAIGFSGNRIAEAILNARLAPLLTDQLGLPVQLAPVTAQLFQLSASSTNLVLGDPGNPAVVAKNINVSLVPAALLQGKIRLRNASAGDLMVRPSSWPRSDNPAPANYEFLDPWLPQSLQLESGRYVNSNGADYPIAQAHWQRQASGRASVQWSQTREAGDITLRAQLESLPDLLRLAPIDLALAIQVANKPGSAIHVSATIKPDKASAYVLRAELQSGDLSARVIATGTSAWSLPDQSTTTIGLLEPGKLLAITRHYRAAAAEREAATLFDSALPLLNLPAHRGQVAIDEIRLEDEVAKSTLFNFTSGDKHLQINKLSSNGPSGILRGELGITSDEQGWSLNTSAALKAQEPTSSLAAAFIDSDWLWETGDISLAGKGATLRSLLNSLAGHVVLAGYHQGKTKTPVSINAQLEARPNVLALDTLSIALGEGRLEGSAVLSGKNHHKLTMDLTGNKVHLGFLFDEEESQQQGVALPEYLGMLPGLDMALTVSINDLDAPGISLAQAHATFERSDSGGEFVASATGKHFGTLNLTLNARTPDDQPNDFVLRIKFADLDLATMFKQSHLLHSRSSGIMNFRSHGEDMQEIFSAMRGDSRVKLDIRADNDWQREAVREEQLLLSGESRLVLNKDRVVGVTIENLVIDSIKQDLTGDLSLVSGRNPWLVSDLRSTKLDVTSLLALLPQTTQEADDSDLLESLRGLGPAQVSLQVESLNVADINLSDMRLEVVSSEALIDLKQFDIVGNNGTLNSHGKIAWTNGKAAFEGTATLVGINLDQFLIRNPDFAHLPVSGSAALSSAGSSFAELLGNLTGEVDLQAVSAGDNDSAQSQRKLLMTATRLPNGMRAEISALQWAGSELSGSLHYYHTTPPSIEVDLLSGSLSLLPWENATQQEAPEKIKQSTRTRLSSAARTSANFVGNALMTPFRLLSSEEDGPAGEKLFSADPLPLDSMKTLDLKITGQLDSLLSNAIEARDLRFTGDLTSGLLSLDASSGDLSQGEGELRIDLDANTQPATLKFASTFRNVHGLTDKETYPRSGFISLQSEGYSAAEFAAGTRGLVYVELGRGPFDYGNSALLTSNLANAVFPILIPSIEQQAPELECGVTVAVFDKGVGITPYGFAARTNDSNLLGRLHIDLGKETMKMSLDSRGRQGVGLSVGTIFSNSVSIEGPLTDPGIVPNTVSLAWRGWAAFMTAGLSVVGESVVKRVLAADDPCKSIKNMIRKELCPQSAIAASSPMACPRE